jgi:hypothetical protein
VKFPTPFDFWQSCPRGGDPDARCHLLRNQHRLLWGRPLPNGRQFELEDRFPDGYLRSTSDEVVMNLSSDSVIPTYASYRRKQARAARAGIADDRLEEFEVLSGGIGGMMLFPGFSVAGKSSINQARGTTYAIGDRMDLTLECIRRHYRKQADPLAELTNPLEGTLLQYTAFFDVFEDFKTYVAHFLLQDLVVEGDVITFLPLEDFKRSGLPRDSAEYSDYMRETILFIHKRNDRMRHLVPEISEHDGVVGRPAAGPCNAGGCARRGTAGV